MKSLTSASSGWASSASGGAVSSAAGSRGGQGNALAGRRRQVGQRLRRSRPFGLGRYAGARYRISLRLRRPQQRPTDGRQRIVPNASWGGAIRPTTSSAPSVQAMKPRRRLSRSTSQGCWLSDSRRHEPGHRHAGIASAAGATAAPIGPAYRLGQDRFSRADHGLDHRLLDVRAGLCPMK